MRKCTQVKTEQTHKECIEAIFSGIFGKAKQKLSHIDASFLSFDANSNNGGEATVSEAVGVVAFDRSNKLSRGTDTFAVFQDLGKSDQFYI